MKNFFKVTLVVFLLFICAPSVVLGVIFLTPPKIEFDEKKLIKASNFTNFYDGQNRLVSSSTAPVFNDEKTFSDTVKKAFISIEDKNFYFHKGLDYKRILKAAFVNLTSLSFKEGASTISQQLIKNTHLTNEKTLSRKITEIKLTKILEKKLPKEEIITAYLNTIYFGENYFGIYDAAKGYFGKTPNELSLSEVATLAGIISAPSKLNPRKNLQAALKKRNLTLNAMQKEGYITEEQKDSAKTEPLILVTPEKDFSSPYFKSVLDEAENLGVSPYLLKDCKIYTYYDEELQKNLTDYQITSDYQAIVLDNKTLGVTAYYSTCGEIEREIASLIKPILIYAPAIEEDYITEYTKVLDEPIDFNGYAPKNYANKYYGEVTIKEAVSKSLNSVAVKTLDAIGVKTLNKYAKKLNIEVENDGLSLALGNLGKGVKLKDLAAAYTMLANYGQYKKPRFIRKIETSKNEIIYEEDNFAKKVFSPSTASLITDALKDCARTGTAKKLSYLPFSVAAKTGTGGDSSGNNVDCYSAAYTTNNTVCVWLGNADFTPLNNETGGNTPTYLAAKFLEFIHKDDAPCDFSTKGLKKAYIDKISYDENGEMLLADDNAPSKYLLEIYLKENTNLPKSRRFSDFKGYEITVETGNNEVKFKIDLPEYASAEIYEVSNGKTSLIYSGNKDFSYSPAKNGIYEYYAVYLINGKTVIKSDRLKLKSVKYEQNYEIPKDWWRD